MASRIPPGTTSRWPHRWGAALPWLAAGTLVAGLAGRAAAAGVPRLDHVVVVVMENKSCDEVQGQPYVASLVAAGGTLLADHAVTHPSQPNYLALWAASTLGVTTDDCPAPGSPFIAENLGHACEAAGKTWRSYSEALPAAGSTVCSYAGDASTGLYTRKHDPWTQFGNLNHMNERPYSDLALDLVSGPLPALTFIVPDNCHNTHNSGTPGCGVPDGDAWLAANLPPILAALGSRGLLILTWDEDDQSAANHVLTVFVGAPVMPGATSSAAATHYTLVRTICDGLALPAFGLAAAEAPVVDLWLAPVPARPVSWGLVKIHYR